MARALILGIILPILLLIGVAMMTSDDLRFDISQPTSLAAEQLKSSERLSFNTQVDFHHTMKFALPIESNDGTHKATLVWPDPPYTRLLVLAPEMPEDSLKELRNGNFSGRLLRCAYRCSSSGMMIEMDEFHRMLSENYPDYKDHFSQLPQFVLDTFQSPKGWQGYARDNEILLGLWGFATLTLWIAALRSLYAVKP